MQARRSGNISSYAAKIENNAVIALSVAGWMLSSRAASLAPVDTGLLASSVTYTPAMPNGEYKYYCLVGPGVEYGRYQELGTYKMKAQPYLRPALRELKTQLKRTIVLYTIGQGKGFMV